MLKQSSNQQIDESNYSMVNLKLRYLVEVEGFSVTRSFSLPKLMMRLSSRFSVR